MPEYTCPECSTVLRSNTPVPEGRKIRCKKCGHAFVPGGTLAIQEEKPPKKDDDLEGDVSPYVVTEEAASGHVVKFGEVQDKFKRSTRGPAMALMVLPTNLLIAQGALTFIAGVVTFIYGIFPLVFADVEPSVSTAGRRLTMALRRAISRVPMERSAVTTAGSPVGMAATARATPVMKLESSDARKRAALAISSGWAGRPSGTPVMKPCIRSATSAPDSRPKN